MRPYESNWQEPGPPGWPHEPQLAGSVSSAAELDVAANADFEIAENVDNFFCSSVLWHDGHSAVESELRTSFSNSLPQALHLNSKMGMVVVTR